MTILITLLVLLAIVLTLTGIVGAIVPALPGPPLSFVSLLIAYLLFPDAVSGSLLLTMGLLTLVVTGIDYVAPVWLTRLGGGSKRAQWGSMLGVIAGLFFLPWGLIVGPLVGAMIGELTEGSDTTKAIKVGLMSLVAFLLTTGLKLVLTLLMTFYTLRAFWHSVSLPNWMKLEFLNF